MYLARAPSQSLYPLYFVISFSCPSTLHITLLIHCINSCGQVKAPRSKDHGTYFGRTYFVGFVCRQRLCINFFVSRANYLTTLRSHLDISCYIWYSLLVMFVGRRLCINFFVSRVNFLTTLHSHLDGTCSCYSWSNLFDLNVNYTFYMYSWL